MYLNNEYNINNIIIRIHPQMNEMLHISIFFKINSQRVQENNV